MPRMPANNRMHTGAALQTHGIWADTIGYDPYAPTTTGVGEASVPDTLPVAPSPYEKAQGLLALARLTGSGTVNSRGTCNKCGGVGHLTFQCRNSLKLNPNDVEVSSTDSDTSDSDDDSSDSEVEQKIKLQAGEKGSEGHHHQPRAGSPRATMATSHHPEKIQERKHRSLSTSPSRSRKRKHSSSRKKDSRKKKDKKERKRVKREKREKKEKRVKKEKEKKEKKGKKEKKR